MAQTFYWLKHLRLLRGSHNFSFRGTKDLANVYLFKVNNKNTTKRGEICSKSTIKVPERHVVKPIFSNKQTDYFALNYSSLKFSLFLPTENQLKCKTQQYRANICKNVTWKCSFIHSKRYFLWKVMKNRLRNPSNGKLYSFPKVTCIFYNFFYCPINLPIAS